MKNALVSALIPTYNRADLLPRAIQSVLDQTYQNFELIIVDNCSTDNTEEVIRSFNNDKIRYIKLDKNYGHIVSRNRCMEEAKGEYLAFCDSDDEWVPKKLEKQLKVFEESNDPDLGVVYSYFEMHDDVSGEKYLIEKGNERGWIYDKLLTGFTPSGVSHYLIKTSVIRDVGLLDPKAFGFDDHDISLRIAQKYTFEFVEEALMIRHEHSHDQIAKDVTHRYDHIKNFLEKWGEEMIRVGGKSVYKKYNDDRVFSITAATLKNPPDNYRKIFSLMFKNLTKTGLAQPKLYVKSLIVYILGPKLFRKLRYKK